MSQAPAPTSVPEPGKARWARASNLSLLLGRGLGLESQAVAGHATPVWQPLVLALATLLLLFTRLDTVLLEPDEGRYAELPRLMNLSGDYLTPRLEGKPYNDKPPLVYWLIAAAYGLLGTEAAVARAVMALMASATVAATYAWARVHVGPTPAFLAGLVLLTQFGFAGFGRMLLLDSTLAFFVVSGLLAGHHAVAGPRLRWGWWLVAAVCVGLGGLAKGPVAGVLVLPPLLLYRWLDSTSCRWGWRAGMLFVGCAVALTAPWYAAMFLTNESFFSEHVVRHHVLRFLEPYHHKKPFWFYGPALVVEMLPWTGIGLAALAGWRSWNGPLRLIVAASTFGFLFFSAASAKLPTYLLPLLPFNAVLMGHALYLGLHQPDVARRQLWLVAAGVLVLVVVLVGRGWVAQHFLEQPRNLWDFSALATVPLVVLGLRCVQPRQGLAWLGGAAYLTCAIAVWHAVPDHAAKASRGFPAGELARWADGQGMPVVAYRGSWEAASFYRGAAELKVFHLEDSDELAAWLPTQERALVLVRIQEGRYDQFRNLVPHSMQVDQVLGEGSPIRGVLVSRRLQP